MTLVLGPCRLELVQGDITLQEVDAIVNAANSDLAGGGGVDGAIHRRGGRAIMDETDVRYPEGCPTGSVVISGAGKLPARFVLHAVGPVWSGGHENEAEHLASCYRQALELAVEHDCRSVAFPAISTGVYAYPLAAAATIALRTIVAFLDRESKPELVRCCLFLPEVFAAFAEELRTIAVERERKQSKDGAETSNKK